MRKADTVHGHDQSIIGMIGSAKAPAAQWLKKAPLSSGALLTPQRSCCIAVVLRRRLSSISVAFHWFCYRWIVHFLTFWRSILIAPPML